MGDRITAERLVRIESLLDAALTLPPGERTDFLARHTGGDPLVLSEVQRLLSEMQTRADALDRAGPALVQGAAVAPGLPAGSRVGAWRVQELVGRGGMGEVYRAERADGAFEQRVALKLVRREAVEHLGRFEAERRMLARLDHPGIARLLDGGVAEDGRPWMAMEWVQGQPITDWCRERGADLHQRLDVFLQVCEAVAYAHRNLLVHRDIKPGNVLVTADGRAKLLDFGVAKLLEGGSAELDLQTQAPVTPAYAAPEQLQQASVTTAADVFALGLLLFELLTGQRPWHRSQMTLVTLVDKLLREPAPAPSAAAAKLEGAPVPHRLLRGDLDAIVGYALRKEPERRYRSAAELTDDLHRHRDGRPVLARPESLAYGLRKLVARNRISAAFAGLALLGLVGGLATALWQAQAARREAVRATATKDFLVHVFRASDPRIAQDKPRGQVTAKELLDLNAPKIAEQFADDPDLQIELLGVTASIYRELGEEQQFRQLHDRQIGLARRHHGDLHPAIIDGLLDDADRANDRNEYAEALRLLEQADPLIRRAGLDRSATRARWWLMRSNVVFDGEEDQDLGGQALEQAINLYDDVAPTDAGYLRALQQKAFSLIGTDPAAAEQLFLRALAAAEKRPDHDDAQLQIYPGLAITRELRDNPRGALEAHERGAELAARTYGEAHSSSWVPAAEHAAALHRFGHRAEAHARFDRLLGAIPASWTQDSYDEYAREFYAARLAAEGRAADAIPLLEAALKVYLEKPSVEYELRRNRLILGDAYDRVGRTDEARAMLKASLDERIAKDPPAAFPVLFARQIWGRFLVAHGDVAAAEEQFREVMKQAGTRRIEPTALALAGLAQVAMARGDLPAALEASRAATETFEHLTGARDVRSGPEIWLIHSEVLRRAGDSQGARAWAERALEASRRYDHPSAPSIARAEAAMKAAGGA